MESDDDTIMSFSPLTPLDLELSTSFDDEDMSTSSTVNTVTLTSDAKPKQTSSEIMGLPARSLISVPLVPAPIDFTAYSSTSTSLSVTKPYENPDVTSTSLPPIQIPDTLRRKMKNLVEYVRARLDSSDQDTELRLGTLPGMSLEEFGERMQASVSFYERIESGAYASLGLHPSSISDN